MQREIDDLKKQLHQAKKKQYPSNSDVSSNDEKDTVYKQRSRTPQSESFSCEDEYFHQRKLRSPSHKGVGTDVMKGSEPNLEITLYTGNRKGETSQTFPPVNVHHV